ncbi:MAG: hypothetical protein ACKVTZ_17405 [Bacteroidia bacterium]
MKEDTLFPNVIHLGKKSKKEIKKYKMGIGTMFMEVQHIVSQAKTQAGAEHEILPMVVVHRKKKKKGLFSQGSSLFKF